MECPETDSSEEVCVPGSGQEYEPFREATESVKRSLGLRSFRFVLRCCLQVAAGPCRSIAI